MPSSAPVEVKSSVDFAVIESTSELPLTRASMNSPTLINFRWAQQIAIEFRKNRILMSLVSKLQGGWSCENAAGMCTLHRTKERDNEDERMLRSLRIISWRSKLTELGIPYPKKR